MTILFLVKKMNQLVKDDGNHSNQQKQKFCHQKVLSLIGNNFFFTFIWNEVDCGKFETFWFTEQKVLKNWKWFVLVLFIDHDTIVDHNNMIGCLILINHERDW
jgi:hypothetical protein